MMNKTEKAAYDAALDDLAAARSMRWPEYETPSHMTHAEIEAGLSAVTTTRRVCRGWFVLEYGDQPSVSHGASTGVSHCREYSDVPNTYNGFSQGAGIMYRTKADALRVLRLKLTNRYATTLARIDGMISE